METLTGGGRIELETCGLALLWSVASRNKHADQPSGDAYAVVPQAGRIVFAVADGAGSGPEAAEVAKRCLDQIRASQSRHLADKFQECHASVQAGRGVALGLAAIDPDTALMSWAAVGDIDGTLWQQGSDPRRPHRQMLQKGGVLGISYAGILRQTHALVVGDIVVLTTDGVSRRDRILTQSSGTLGQLVEDFMNTHGHEDEDSLVLAFQVVAAGP